MTSNLSRRELLGSGTVALALAVAGCKSSKDSEADVTANEDLMREHGILERLLVVYEAAAKGLDHGDRAMADPIRSAARIAREFVEDYHEHIEEAYVFPELERARRLTDVVATLRRQHDAGRGLTDRIKSLAQSSLTNESDRTALAAALRGYATMFRPHVAREDTDVFPMFRQVVGKSYDQLGDKFEDEEHKRFGQGGFERFVTQLPAIETAAGVGDLTRFTITLEDLDTPGAGRS